MKQWNQHICYLALAASLVGPSCGSTTTPVPVAGTETGAARTGLLGTWEGLYISKTPGLTQQESPVTVSFEGETEGQGRFTIRLSLQENAQVKGLFKDFAGKSLILNVQESSVSTLGLTGSTTDLPYELTGNSLQLGNDRVTLKLTRKTQDQQPAAKSPGDKPTGLLGHWRCLDQLAKVWNVNIRQENKFSIDVTEPTNVMSYLWLDGRVEKGVQAENSIFIVEKSSNEKYKGLQFKAELQSATTLVLVRTQLEDQKKTETVSCSKL